MDLSGSKKVKEFDDVIVATEDFRVKDESDSIGIKCVITSDDRPTGMEI